MFPARVKEAPNGASERRKSPEETSELSHVGKLALPVALQIRDTINLARPEAGRASFILLAAAEPSHSRCFRNNATFVASPGRLTGATPSPATDLDHDTAHERQA